MEKPTIVDSKTEFQNKLTSLIKNRDVQIEVASACFRSWADDEIVKLDKEKLDESHAYLANPLFTEDDKRVLRSKGNVALNERTRYDSLQQTLFQNIASLPAVYCGINYFADNHSIDGQHLLADLAEGKEDPKTQGLLRVMANSNWMVTMIKRDKMDSEKVAPFDQLPEDVREIDSKQIMAIAKVLASHLK